MKQTEFVCMKSDVRETDLWRDMYDTSEKEKREFINRMDSKLKEVVLEKFATYLKDVFKVKEAIKMPMEKYTLIHFKIEEEIENIISSRFPENYLLLLDSSVSIEEKIKMLVSFLEDQYKQYNFKNKFNHYPTPYNYNYTFYSLRNDLEKNYEEECNEIYSQIQENIPLYSKGDMSYILIFWIMVNRFMSNEN